MIDYKEAQDIIRRQRVSLGKELIDLDDATGRVLAEDITAGRDYPPFNRSAMDGIAIQTEDFRNGIRNFIIIETIFAGQRHKKELSTGQCYKIMTGAAVPLCADAVIRREDVIENGQMVMVMSAHCSDFQNIALKGQDLQKNSIAIHAPFKVNSSSIGFLASLGRSKLWVYKKPEVVIFTTGNEVISLGEPVNDVQIYNSNLYMLKALLLQNAIKPAYSGHILDNEKALTNAINPHLQTNLLILSGGVSAGEADFIPEVLSELGVEILFHKVAIKPGKPVLCGKLPGGGLVFALPGNPLSCLVTFKLFVEAYLESIWRVQTQTKMVLPVNFNRAKINGLDEFFPVLVTDKGLVKTKSNGSGDIRLASFANALAVQPSAIMNICSGELVDCILL